MEPIEYTRRILPWILLTKFRNVMLNLPSSIKDAVEPEIVIRNLDLYVADNIGVYVPGASSLLYVPYLKYDALLDEEASEIHITPVDGFVSGFMPNGKYTKIPVKFIEEKDGPVTLKYDGDNFSDFAVSIVTRNIYRLRAGKYFASRLKKSVLEKNGIHVSKYKDKELELSNVVVKSRNVEGSVKIRIFLYDVIGKYPYVVPGIVPGILTLIQRGELRPYPEDVEEELNKFLDELASIGGRISPISGGLLKQVSRTRFTYHIGEISGPERAIKNLKVTHRGDVWLGGEVAYKGVRVDFHANPDNRKLYMTISVVPFNPPATIVLNYPPFNIMALSALVNQRRDFLRYQIEKEVRSRAKRYGLNIGSFHNDLAVLSDANITFEDIRNVLKDGYPKIPKLRKIMYRFEKLGHVADLVAMTIGDIYKVDKLLVSQVKPKTKVEKETKVTPTSIEEEEMEEALL